jgi:hypothetical protein
MSNQVSQLLRQLEPDGFRDRTPFETSIAVTADRLLKSTSYDDSAIALSEWLGRFQPCLFGKITARLGGLAYCFLSESDLEQSDEHIHDKIQEARRRWRRKAFAGDASGFVILAVSQKIATAVPNEVVKNLAKRLCYLYLGKDEEDEILLEDVFLRVPGKRDAEMQWKAGVNYFCAQGDQRWWQDHRIPAGMAFSVNSVGHLVKSFQVGRSFEEAWAKLNLHEEGWRNFKIESLGDALASAMQTINGAANAISGKATFLLPAEPNEDAAACPVSLPKNLHGKNFCEYFGYYHTDFTLPSEYFRPDVTRPPELKGQNLDFTYLFNESLDNPAFTEMGKGVWVRAGGRSPVRHRRISAERKEKLERVVPTMGRISDHPELQSSLDQATE